MAQQILNTPRETTHQRIAAALEAIEQNMSDEHEAVNIDYDNTTSGLSANKVQSAIDELALAGFVTNTVNNLVNYYLKSETYNKAEVDSLINAVKNSRFEAVSTLPTTNIKTNVIYLVPKSPTQTNNAKDEYINLDGTSSGWEKIGDTEVDLSGYVTTTALNTALSNYTTTVNLTNLLNNKVDKETGKGLSTNDYTDTEKQKLSGIEAGANKTVVDSAMSDSSTNPLQNKVITKELEGAKTTSDNPLTIEDAAPVNAVNLSVDLEPVQDLHGYDYPWVGGAGKNKLPLTVAEIKALNTGGTWSGNVCTLSNVTFEILADSDGNVIGIKTNGTASANTNLILIQLTGSQANSLFGNNNYYLSGCASGGSNTSYYLRIFTDPWTIIATNTTDNSTSFSTDSTLSTYNLVLCVIGVDSGTNMSGKIFYPMIRLATETDSSFAPYTNICPISGRSEVAIERVGKNWLNPNTIKTGKVVNFTNGDIISNANYWTSDYIDVHDVSYIACSGTANFNSAEKWFYDKDKNPLQKASLNVSVIPVPTGAYYYCFSRENEYSTSDGMVERGNTATTFEPYAGKTYTIQLGDTIYGGELDVTTGELRVTHELWTKNTSTMNNVEDYPGWINCGIKELVGDGFDILIENQIMNIGTDYGVNTQERYDILYLPRGTYGKTQTEWKALAQDIEIAVELAEPYTIQLTPQQIKMLENTNTLSTDYEGDTITIEYQPNNAIGEAVRAVEESYDPEFAVRPVLKKKAFSGTTDSDGAVTLINASDIPSNHRIIPLHITDMTIDGSAGTYFVEYEPYNSGDSVKGYCYFYMSGSQMFPVGKAITGNFYYYELEG